MTCSRILSEFRYDPFSPPTKTFSRPNTSIRNCARSAELWGAQAASLLRPAACRTEFLLSVAVVGGQIEMWILNNTEDVAEWIENRGDPNTVADILNRSALSGTERKQTLQSCTSV
jgi:hypothetical protein